jgi:hypothetical protein
MNRMNGIVAQEQSSSCRDRILILMQDLIYVGVVLAFFIVSGLYVRFCEKL